MTKNCQKSEILVTGANGFIGSSLVNELIRCGYFVHAVQRGDSTEVIGALSVDENNIKLHYIENIDAHMDWSAILSGVDTVIHLAAITHVTNDLKKKSITDYRRINVDGTLNLARQASAYRVKRFIYLSSVKVHGESSTINKPFTAEDVVNPQNPYAISKAEAEYGLRELAGPTGMEIVIIRPPLVYGPGVKANFLSMIRCVSMRIPLPLGAIDNLRSFVALDNLINLIIKCISHPGAKNQTFLVSDGVDVSTAAMLRIVGSILGKSVLLIPVPIKLLYFCAALFGKRDMAIRLCSSLQIDMSKTCKLLEWSPIVKMEEGLRNTLKDFQK